LSFGGNFQNGNENMSLSTSDDLLPLVPDTSITPSADPHAEKVRQQSSRKGILWKWSLGLTAILLTYFMWQCGSALVQGRTLANAAVHHFHEKLNSGQYEEICRSADQAFTAAQGHEEVVKFLTAVHRKLGNAGAESQVNIRVDSNTNGTFITTFYRTEFASGAATETFTWRKSGGAIRLLGYNVQSSALLN
jgi:Protein of unknown function (DUF4019)